MAAKLRRLWYKVESVALESAGDEKKVTVYHLPRRMAESLVSDLEAVSKHAGLPPTRWWNCIKPRFTEFICLDFPRVFHISGGWMKHSVPTLEEPSWKSAGRFGWNRR